jgi:hypothetical protein
MLTTSEWLICAHGLKGSAEQGESDTNTMQDMFGSAGDPDASNLMQEAKIYADPCSRRQ